MYLRMFINSVSDKLKKVHVTYTDEVSFISCEFDNSIRNHESREVKEGIEMIETECMRKRLPRIKDRRTLDEVGIGPETD